jgi:DNA-binding transcriptional regulator YiaG
MITRIFSNQPVNNAMNAALLELLDIAAQCRTPLTMAEKLLPRLLSYVGAERGSIFLLSGERVVYQVLANRESFAEVAEYKVNTALANGLAGWALSHRQGALASNTKLDERWVSLDNELAASAIAVPMINCGAVIGLLIFHHSTPGFFRERHLASMAEAAQIVAPMFDSSMIIASTMECLVQLNQTFNQPAALLDYMGTITSVNQPLSALDVIWEGADISQSILARDLNISSTKDCAWEGERDLPSLPYRVRAVRIHGVGVWLQFSPK